MNTFVESLKRLYQQGKVPEIYINGCQKNMKITEEERLYILGKDGNDNE